MPREIGAEESAGCDGGSGAHLVPCKDLQSVPEVWRTEIFLSPHFRAMHGIFPVARVHLTPKLEGAFALRADRGLIAS